MLLQGAGLQSPGCAPAHHVKEPKVHLSVGPVVPFSQQAGLLAQKLTGTKLNFFPSNCFKCSSNDRFLAS